jgi:hypothetical protein
MVQLAAGLAIFFASASLVLLLRTGVSLAAALTGGGADFRRRR